MRIFLFDDREPEQTQSVIGVQFYGLAKFGDFDLKQLLLIVFLCILALCQCGLACTATGATATGRAIMVQDQVRPASCTRACIVRGPSV